MPNDTEIAAIQKKGRTMGPATSADAGLGPLELLKGTWKNTGQLEHHGWNMIALPWIAPKTEKPNDLNYRLLLNQYDETLVFDFVDSGIPNRGISQVGATLVNSDQFLSAVTYDQKVIQFKGADFPPSPLVAPNGSAIHFEPGLWLHLNNQFCDGLDIARLATIPHGDSVLALGRHFDTPGAPTDPKNPASIHDINGLPIGVPHDLNSHYLLPYKHFHKHLFEGLFDPTRPNDLLKGAIQGVDITKTTVLTVDTTIDTGGIHNIPFVVRQADAATMKSTFWIRELAEKDASGKPKMWLQYSQIVMLHFFPRPDGAPGRIEWPHISINTLEKQPDTPQK